jgi:hypothetical protein
MHARAVNLLASGLLLMTEIGVCKRTGVVPGSLGEGDTRSLQDLRDENLQVGHAAMYVCVTVLKTVTLFGLSKRTDKSHCNWTEKRHRSLFIVNWQVCPNGVPEGQLITLFNGGIRNKTGIREFVIDSMPHPTHSDMTHCISPVCSGIEETYHKQSPVVHSTLS